MFLSRKFNIGAGLYRSWRVEKAKGGHWSNRETVIIESRDKAGRTKKGLGVELGLKHLEGVLPGCCWKNWWWSPTTTA